MSIAKNKSRIYYIEVQGDTLTPVSIFQKLNGSKKFLLESSLKHLDEGRYSFIGSNPAFELLSSGNENTLIFNTGERRTIFGSPLDVIGNLIPECQEDDFPFPFFSGAAGYAGYDVIRLYENIGEQPADPLGMPDAHFLFYEEMAVFDHHEQKVYLAGMPLLDTTDENSLRERLLEREEELKRPSSESRPEGYSFGGFTETMAKQDFISAVHVVKQHIEDGNIFQAVLSHRLHSDFTGSPFSAYRKLRTHNPSPYMFYIEFGEYTVLGSSPESLVKVAGRTVFTNPIAGTRPRGDNAILDSRLEEELKEDEKELAEHRMLVDLGRNDLGKICEFGSITVSKYLDIEKYRHVMHLVSELKGKLLEGISPLSSLAACLPAGTVSGAPKIRAMEIINQLEGTKRGLYSGAIGYISACGNLDFALAIRTMIIKGNKAYIQAGAGIVHDSIPEAEYEETLNKLKLFKGGLS